MHVFTRGEWGVLKVMAWTLTSGIWEETRRGELDLESQGKNQRKEPPE